MVCTKDKSERRILVLGMIATMAFVGISCDSHSGIRETNLISDRPPRDCDPPEFSSDEFAIRFINISDLKIDSVDISITKEAGHYPMFRDTYAVQSDARLHCYVVLPKTYNDGRFGEGQYQTLRAIPRGENFYLGYPSLQPLRVESAVGRYAYLIDIRRVREFYFRNLPFGREDQEGPSVQLRVVNESTADFREIKYHFAGRVVEVPFLAAGDSTDYFEITRAHIYNLISLIAGQDTVSHGPVDQLPGAQYIGNGHYVSRLDTFHAIQYWEIAEIVADES